MIKKKEILRLEIEKAREQLNMALAGPNDVATYYELSVKLDELIEIYIEMCENETNNIEMARV